MTTVAEILTKKAAAPLVWEPPNATVRQALQLLADWDVGAVLVMQEGQALLGIFTERDYARKIALMGKSSTDALLADVMTTRLYVVGPQQSVQECMGIMTKAHVRHLPVVEAGKVLGIVSIGDLVNATLEEQRYLIEQLESYIAGNLG